MGCETSSLLIANEMAELKRLPQLVEEFGEANCFPPKLIFQITLILDELVTNSISYGYMEPGGHQIRIDLSFKDQRLTIRLEDDAGPFNPLEAPPPELDLPLEERNRQVGGMGIHLVRTLVDQLNYERVDGKNVLVLTKELC